MRDRKIGTVLSYVGVFLGILIGLGFTPFLLKCLGQSQYGIYILMASMTSYLYVLEAGFADTILRYITRYRAKEDKIGLENFNAVVLIFNTIIAIIIAFVGSGILKILPDLYGKTLTFMELKLANELLTLMIINITFTVLANLFTGYILAHEKFIFTRCLDIGNQIIGTGAMVLVLFLGYKALAIVVVTTICNLCAIFLKMFFCFSRLKIKIKFHRCYINKELYKEMFLYSLSVFIVVVAEQVYWKLDNAIIGMFASSSMIAVYSIGMSFQKYFMRFAYAIGKIMSTHLFLKVDSGAISDEITNLLIKISRIQALVICLPLIGLIVYGKEFIYLWVGKDYHLSYYIAVVVLIPYCFDIIGNLRGTIMQAKGIYMYKSYTSIIICILKVILTIVLLKIIGILGAAIATAICVLIVYNVITQILRRKVGIDNIKYIKETYRGIFLFSFIVGLISWGIKYFMPANNWALFFVNIAILTIIYIFIMFKFATNKSEKEMFLGMIKKGKMLR